MARTLLIGAWLCVALAGCTRHATQLLVVVDSDLPLDRRTCIRAVVTSVEEGTTDEETFFTAASRQPRGDIRFSFAVSAPRNNPSNRVTIAVSALAGPDCTDVTVTRRVRTGFVSEQALAVPVFLASSCLGVVCDGDTTCESGMCVAVPLLETGDLGRVTTPGDELASFDDTGLHFDAGRPSDTGGSVPDSGMNGADAGSTPTDFAPTLPGATTFSLPQTANNLVYPVGARGNDRVIVAGLTSSALMVGTTSIAANSFWLAMLAPDGTPSWVNPSAASTFPHPVMRRVVPFGPGYVACGSLPASGFSPSIRGVVTPIRCADTCAFVARLSPTGEYEAIHTIDASAGEVWCSDIAFDGARVWLTARTFAAADVRIDGTATPPSAGTFSTTNQNQLIFEVSEPTAGFNVSAPIVAGQAPGSMRLMFGTTLGSPLFTASDGASGRIYATLAQSLTPTGSGAPGTRVIRAARFDAGGARLWESLPVTRLSSGADVNLDAMAVAPGSVWLAITGAPGAAGDTVQFGTLPAKPISPLATFVVRLDATTGAVVSATSVGVTTGFQASGEDRMISTPISRQLLGGDLAATSAGDVLYAGTAAMGETIDGVMVTATGEHDANLSIVGPDGSTRGRWQWTDRPELDTRLTHVVWMPGGWVATAGYIEDDSTFFRRGGAFFEIRTAR